MFRPLDPLPHVSPFQVGDIDFRDIRTCDRTDRAKARSFWQRLQEFMDLEDVRPGQVLCDTANRRARHFDDAYKTAKQRDLTLTVDRFIDLYDPKFKDFDFDPRLHRFDFVAYQNQQVIGLLNVQNITVETIEGSRTAWIEAEGYPTPVWHSREGFCSSPEVKIVFDWVLENDLFFSGNGAKLDFTDFLFPVDEEAFWWKGTLGGGEVIDGFLRDARHTVQKVRRQGQDVPRRVTRQGR